MKTVKLQDYESLRRYYLSSGNMVSEVEVNITNQREFLFERENLKLSILSLETGDFFVKMISGFMTDFPNEECYILSKPTDFFEGNRQDVIDNGCGWIFKTYDEDKENENGFQLDNLEYDSFIENDGIVHNQVFPSLYGVESSTLTHVILNLWSSEDERASEKYIFALEVGELISLYEGYIIND